MNARSILSLAIMMWLSSGTVMAQQPSFQWSEKGSPGGAVFFGGRNGDTIFSIEHISRKIDRVRGYLVRDSLAPIKSLDYEVASSPSLALKSVVTGRHQIMLREESVGKRRKQLDLVSQQTNEVGAVMNRVSLVQLEVSDKATNVVYFSDDHSKMLLCSFEDATKGVTNVSVIDARKGVLMYKTSFEDPGNAVFDDDNKGNTWFTVQQKAGEDAQPGSLSHINYSVLVISPNGISKRFPISIPDGFSPSADIVQGEGQEVFVAGFVYDEDPGKRRQGPVSFFVYRFDTERMVITDSAASVCRGSVYSPGSEKKDNWIPYRVHDICRKNEGGYTAVAEQFKLTIVANELTQQWNDILCLQLKPDMSVESTLRIPKRQNNFENPSIASVLVHDTVYIVYSDAKKNLEASGDDVAEPALRSEKNGLFLLRIAPNNRYTKELLLDYAADMPEPLLILGQPLDSRTIFFPTSDQRIGLLRLRE